MRDKKQNMPLQEIKVSTNMELLPFLIEKGVRKSRNAVKSLLIHKQIRVNNKVVSQHNYVLNPGDTITIHKHDHKRDTKKLKGLTIIYEDKDIIVVDKESGLLSISAGNQLKETAFNIVNNYLKAKNATVRAYVLFRLDRETSGLMVYAKSTDIQEDLQKAWITKPPKRTFLTVVEGRITPENGTITSWLTENKNFQMFANSFDNGGQKAVMHYQTIHASNKFSFLSLELETARKNQARVQLQSVGHPIVGDKKYGSKISPIRRIALHANKLAFIHPVTKEKLEFESALPKKMQIMADTILPKKEEID